MTYLQRLSQGSACLEQVGLNGSLGQTHEIGDSRYRAVREVVQDRRLTLTVGQRAQRGQEFDPVTRGPNNGLAIGRWSGLTAEASSTQIQRRGRYPRLSPLLLSEAGPASERLGERLLGRLVGNVGVAAKSARSRRHRAEGRSVEI
jgi:hypothetical protein